jgi:hypothetical protein
VQNGSLSPTGVALGLTDPLEGLRDDRLPVSIDPVGLKYSSLTHSSAPLAGTHRRKRTIGVFAIPARMSGAGRQS